ncbi:MAG: sulfotransferase [Pseudomonadota bacterium]
MPSRRELDEAFARHPVVGSEPRTDIYGRLGVHPDRLNPKNLIIEAKVFARTLRRNDTPKPFVIYGRPRSGTTLLVRLLDQVPAVRCEGERLHYLLLDPVGFLARLPRRAGRDVRAYGVKLISYHLMEIQRIRRPLAFFDRIADFDYSVLHLTRNTWDQTLSLAKAHASGLYFMNDKAGVQTLRLDPERFLALLTWNAEMLAYETEVMAHVPHHPIRYDTDLKDADRHQATIDDLCAYLGVPSAPVKATMKRTGGKTGLQRVENLDEVAAHIRQSDLAHLVPDGL